MEVMTIMIIIVLNIALPTLDTFTDIILVGKLYRGVQSCVYDGGPDYKECLKDEVGYCSNDENNQDVCDGREYSYSLCQWPPLDSDD